MTTQKKGAENMTNATTIKMQLKRREVLDLLILLNVADIVAMDAVNAVAPADGHPTNGNTSKWRVLHNKLRQILDEADQKAERS